ncbi:hypothetical protein IAT38_008051 [Cryptococcus sp. DSM 104549]
MPQAYPVPTQMVQQLWERFTAYMMRSYPIRDLPLHIRPGMVFATAGWLIILGILGMAPLPELPVNDKALHFFGLGFATFLLYFVIQVPEGPGRRVWYIRRAPLLVTLFCAFFVGGIVSEFVQATLPWKTFQFGDILANLLGSTLFLYLAHLAYSRHLKRQELSSLYQPLSAQSSATYRDAQGREHAFSSAGGGSGGEAGTPLTGGAAGGSGGRERGGSGVWDEESDEGGRGSEETARGGGRSAVFGIGDEEDELTPQGKPRGVELV